MKEALKKAIGQGEKFFNDVVAMIPTLSKIPLDSLTAEQLSLLLRLTTSCMCDVLQISCSRDEKSGGLIVESYRPTYTFCDTSTSNPECPFTIYIRDDQAPSNVLTTIHDMARCFPQSPNAHSDVNFSNPIPTDFGFAPIENYQFSSANNASSRKKSSLTRLIPEDYQDCVWESTSWHKKYQRKLIEWHTLRIKN